ncbi:MBL fold metallo-hydrolase [Acidisoma cellulosilytica]|uniref:MBL fold metallo-hydrolase n=1 Tax=Acidisoma cellulosilyticum TaxID=2802395 RepID=A0A963YZ78_9PROT|nr:MBL fold metallo-hydrolase [Acidisoma cellulosilyticum]MCB8879868.1 MBL fold metallo-hydrolase [Acidisoma cellulosilyticum]
MTDTSAQTPAFYKWMVGDIEVIALHEGWLAHDMPKGFAINATDEAVAEAYAAAGMPADKLTITFTTLAVRTAGKVVLIDTGLGEFGPPTTGRMLGNLAAAGIQPEEVSTIVISHLHGDHILGLRRKDESMVFPNAEILVPNKDWEFWMDDAKMEAAPEAMKGNFGACRMVFSALADKVRHYAWDEEVAPGLTAVRANGHTPGMSAIRIASAGETMMFVADITNNPLVFARHPDWAIMFDIDPVETVATRKRILDLAAAEKMRVSFYHAPFPATGFIVKTATGYEFLPALWQ